MITRQYPILKHIIHFVIFIFHISALFLLYHYSTKFSQNHVLDSSSKQLNKDIDQLSSPKQEEAIVTFQQDAVDNPVMMEKIVAKAEEDEKIDLEQEIPTQKKESIYNQTQRPLIKTVWKPIANTKPAHSSTKNTNSAQSISPKDFLQAFKASYYREQAQLGNVDISNNSISSLNSESESLINQRLGELKIADYLQQIKKAFHDAARRTPGTYLYSNKELKTDIDVKLDIQNNGTVKIMKFQSSGIDQLDNYIKKFLSDIIVGPIPKRYKVNSLPFSTKILINLDKNTQFYTIRCFL